MGVQGLWPLLEPVGRRIKIEALSNKTLAVDASVWLFQFIKAMRDERGELIKNAHLLGFFRRICRLLFHKIRPVFVFDGATPALKKRTTIARRRRREQQDAKLRKTAEKLLLNQLKQHALGNVQKAATAGAAREASKAPRGGGAVSGRGMKRKRQGKQPMELQQGEAAAEEEEVQDEGARAGPTATETPAYARVTPFSATAAAAAVAAAAVMDDRPGPSQSHSAATATAGANAGGPGAPLPSSTLDELLAAQLYAEEWEDVDPTQRNAGQAVEPEPAGVGGGNGSKGGVAGELDAEMGQERGGEEEADGDDLAADLEMLLPEDGELDPEVLSTLPPSLQLDIMMRAREQRMVTNREKFEARSGVPASFSEFQLQQYLKASALRRQVEQVRTAVNATAAGGEAARRIAAEAGREYVLQKEQPAEEAAAAAPQAASYGAVEDDEAALVISFEVPLEGTGAAGGAEGEGSDLDWEDVGPSPAGPPGCDADPSKMHWRERAAQRQRYWSLSHGFQKGRALADWGRDAGPGQGATGRHPFEVDQDDAEFQHAIQLSLQEQGPGEAPNAAAEQSPALSDGEEEFWDDAFPAEHEAMVVQLKQLGGPFQEPDLDLTSSPTHQLPAHHPAAESLPHAGIAPTAGPSRAAPVTAPSAIPLAATFATAASKDESGAAGAAAPPAAAVAPTVSPLAISLAAAAPAAALPEESNTVRPNGDQELANSSARLAASPPLPTLGVSIQAAIPSPPSFGAAALLAQAEAAASPTLPLSGSAISDSAACPQAPTSSVAAAAVPVGAPESTPVPAPVPAPAQPSWQEQPASRGASAEEAGGMAQLDDVAVVPPAGTAERSEPAKECDAGPVQPEGNTRPPPSQPFLDFDPATDIGTQLSDLQREERRLRDAHRAHRGQADAPTSEMYAECQELLQMFGIPYIIAPMEAESQCAWLDERGLVDGVITDDNDVFLFGGQRVYRNIFQSNKFVEEFFSKDIECELGLSRDKLMLLALLLGSDYTPGISGVGIVNAVEIVNSFPTVEDFKLFKKWVDSPAEDLLDLLQQSGEAGRLDVGAPGAFYAAHKSVRKGWDVPDNFPDVAVIEAYSNPKIDSAKDRFTFGRPDLELLRNFCTDCFGWNTEKADELLLPVLSAYDTRQAQLTMDAFLSQRERFAKIKSKRLQKALGGIQPGMNMDILFERSEGTECPKEEEESGKSAKNDKKAKKKKS